MQNASPDAQSKPPQDETRFALVPGQLRLLEPYNLLVRLVEQRGKGWTVELVVGNVQFFSANSRALRDAPIADPEGFRVALAQGCLPADHDRLLALILRDERARGRTGLRLRSLVEYVDPLPDAAELVQSL